MEELMFDQKTPGAPVDSPNPQVTVPESSEPELTKASWEKSTALLDTASHDLRSPLSAIILYVEHLLKGDEGPLNDEQAKILQVVTENTKRLANFINNLIDLHKISRGGLKFNRSPQHIENIVSEIVELYQVVAERTGIELNSEITPNLPAVWANGPKIEQVIINLLSNALKFTPKHGRVNVRLELLNTQEIQCSIQDSGPGIPTKDLEELFKDYSQLDVEQHRQIAHGAGLGLLISKQIIALHGGRIWAESWPGRGSAFYFTLPQKPPQGAA